LSDPPNKLFLVFHLEINMVRVIPSTPEDVDTLKAFLITRLSASQLKQFKRAFEKGAKVHFRPMMHLKIIQAPESYLNATIAHIRTAETEAGNTDPFVVIDRRAVDSGAVWYVADFADEDDIQNGFAESEDVVMRALVRTELLAISHVCWQQGNPPMGEELEALDCDIVPLRTDSEQAKPVGADDGDKDRDEMWSTDEVEVIAEAGEYEITTDYEIRSNMSPMPEEAVRLLPAVAKREKLISVWTWPESSSDASTQDGSQEAIPAGSIRFGAKLDQKAPRLLYEWPGDSL
jgi:hypothetical protein